MKAKQILKQTLKKYDYVYPSNGFEPIVLEAMEKYAKIYFKENTKPQIKTDSDYNY